jgi:hypothetical protein
MENELPIGQSVGGGHGEPVCWNAALYTVQPAGVVVTFVVSLPLLFIVKFIQLTLMSFILAVHNSYSLLNTLFY